jgi:glutamate/tyrosine decarboxylase-like PLP-dependent enzyme
MLGEPVRADGLPSSPRARIYCSSGTHTWVQKAADLSGLGTDAVRWVATDDELRMDMDSLRSALAEDRGEGFTPFIVVGTAGSVSTGAVDPLGDIARLCADEGLWFHVDGAYGGFAAVAPGVPADMAAMALADSVAVDPHKWLYTPLEAGCALVRDPEHMRNAFSYHPPYYYFGQEATNYVDFGMQNSRGFRALKVWMQLKHAGRSGYERMIGDDIRLAEHLHRLVTDDPRFEAVARGLSISTFRFVPEELRASVGGEATEDYLNRLNQDIQGRLERGGELFISNAVVRGKYLLRACIVNYNTTLSDVEAVPDIVARVGAEAHAGLGGP